MKRKGEFNKIIHMAKQSFYPSPQAYACDVNFVRPL